MPKLNPDRLYLGDNGRAFCGALRCAGMTAHSSGRDLSGQRVYKIRPEDIAEHERMSREMAPHREPLPLACESCGRRATAVAGTDGGAIVGDSIDVAATLAEIKRLQAVQKQHPPTAPEWKKASAALAPLFRKMAAAGAA